MAIERTMSIAAFADSVSGSYTKRVGVAAGRWNTESKARYEKSNYERQNLHGLRYLLFELSLPSVTSAQSAVLKFALNFPCNLGSNFGQYTCERPEMDFSE
jgi:hypothetical protein